METFLESQEYAELQVLLKRLTQEPSPANTIPLSVFSTSTPPLASLVMYLAEHHTPKEIANILHRSDKTIYQAMNTAKRTGFVPPSPKGPYLPLEIYEDRKLSIAEHTVRYLKQQGMTFSQIAHALDNDPRTVWTTWNRGVKKCTN